MSSKDTGLLSQIHRQTPVCDPKSPHASGPRACMGSARGLRVARARMTRTQLAPGWWLEVNCRPSQLPEVAGRPNCTEGAGAPK